MVLLELRIQEMQTKTSRSVSSSAVAIMQNKYGGFRVLQKDIAILKFPLRRH